MKPVSISDYRDAAKRRLPKFLFEYIDGGSYDEVTLRRNVTDLQDISLRQRVLRDVSSIDLSTTILGKQISLPVVLAPVGLAGMNARRGEVQAVRAAENAGVPFTLSTVSACSLGEVASASTRPFWFQLYMMRDRSFMELLLDQAEAAGCDTLVFTVDMPVPGSRYRDYRSGLAGASGAIGALRRFGQAATRPRWAWDVGICGRPHVLGNVAPLLGNKTGLEDFFAWMSANFDASANWKDLEWVRSKWKGKIVLKGVLEPEDAKLAVGAGADGIVVSNHGGRQLDGVKSAARALPDIAAAVCGSLTIFADGGVRSGLDIVRLLALGADAVMIGRAWAYALAAGGEMAIGDMLTTLSAEMRVAMALTGTVSINAIGPDNVSLS